jgi:pyridoxine 5-phosphate synthase
MTNFLDVKMSPAFQNMSQHEPAAGHVQTLSSNLGAQASSHSRSDAHIRPLLRLGVNIDHVATVRNARGTLYPDPVEAAVVAVHGGADQITVHLREDRRHITDRDVVVLKHFLQVPLNLEMACTHEMLEFALKVKPSMVTLVPEKREERTTEGGLELRTRVDALKLFVEKLASQKIIVSLFVEPDPTEMKLSKEIGAHAVELHTGKYAELCEAHHNATHIPVIESELNRLRTACLSAHSHGLIVHAGHGLNMHNVMPVALLPHMNDLNIGHSIVARSLFVGLQTAVKEMKEKLGQAQVLVLKS